MYSLTDDLVITVPYGNTKHRADVEVRELVCLKRTGVTILVYSDNYHPSEEK